MNQQRICKKCKRPFDEDERTGMSTYIGFSKDMCWECNDTIIGINRLYHWRWNEVIVEIPHLSVSYDQVGRTKRGKGREVRAWSEYNSISLLPLYFFLVVGAVVVTLCLI